MPRFGLKTSRCIGIEQEETEETESMDRMALLSLFPLFPPVQMQKPVIDGLARWPNQRLSALTWLIHILCLEMDRHMGVRPPF
jgi:hypothetical protein